MGSAKPSIECPEPPAKKQRKEPAAAKEEEGNKEPQATKDDSAASKDTANGAEAESNADDAEAMEEDAEEEDEEEDALAFARCRFQDAEEAKQALEQIVAKLKEDDSAAEVTAALLTGKTEQEF